MAGRTEPPLSLINCTPWHPIFADCNDVLTDSTAKQIEAHDETGVRLHCWPKPAPTPNACKKKS